MPFQRAERRRAKARIAITGPSGSGKSMAALLIAKGLGGKIAAIDTENESLSLYSHIVPFDVAVLKAPFSPERYIELIHEAEQAGYDTIIIDSLTHEWTGPGGILEIHDAMPGNSWANWSKVTPRHNRLIETMLQSPCHIIATMRSKTEYVQQESNGKQTIQKAGSAPQQRDGIDYEFTLCLDLQQNHIAGASKDRTGLFDGKYEIITEEHGKRLLEWLESGVEPVPAQPQPKPQLMARQDPSQSTTQQPTTSATQSAQQKRNALIEAMMAANLSQQDVLDIIEFRYEKHSPKELSHEEREDLLKFLGQIARGELTWPPDLEAPWEEPAPEPPPEPEITDEDLAALDQHAQEQATPQPAKRTPGGLTEKQIRRLYAIGHDAGASAEEIKSLMASMFGIEHADQLNREQYDTLCNTLQNSAVKSA